MRVLLIEDDKFLGKAICTGLKQEYTTDWFRTAEEGDDALLTCCYNLIVLDINLPKMSGLEWLLKLRQKKSTIAVLLLTAKDTTRERIEGLDAGADDYLIKPFDFEELLARIRALSRRREHYHPPIITFADMTLDTNSKTVTKEGKPLGLSQKEFAILALLIESVGYYTSKEKIEQQLYSFDEEIGSNTVEVHISSLRRKLGKHSIHTIRNIGYRLEQKP